MDLRTSMALRSYGMMTPPAGGINSQTQNKTSDAVSGFTLDDKGGNKTLFNQTQAPRQDFSSMMYGLAQQAVQNVQTGEQTSLAGLDNKADTQTVVEAMTNAEMTVRTAIAIRDKVVEAYQEILRMPI